MKWTVLREENGRIVLISDKNTKGLLPKGSFLTIEDDDVKFILRVDDSKQTEPYEPSPFIIDMDLPGLGADTACKNIVYANRVKTIGRSKDGLVHFIHPLQEARRSTQDEISFAMGNDKTGPKVLVATIYANEDQILVDENSHYITAMIPEEFYYYQTMICGKTGSGKTVAMKYFAQYFVEKIGGAVLAINVKGDDFLHMDSQSIPGQNTEIVQEWNNLGLTPKGIDNFVTYIPACSYQSNTYEKLSCIKEAITLDINDIEPEALSGILTGITDKAASFLPGLFRKWIGDWNEKRPATLTDFINHLTTQKEDRQFIVRNENGDDISINIHSQTIMSLISRLTFASSFFDNPNATVLKAEDILQRGKMSVIDVSNNMNFGSIILRDILKKLVLEKDQHGASCSIPLLIIIDEVHQFYNDSSSKVSLDYLDTICRTGRSKKIGVFFASQNPSDMPSGIAKVVNTRMFFKADVQSVKEYGIKVTSDELESLKSGYAVVSVHNMPQLRIVKIPLSLSGVVDND